MAIAIGKTLLSTGVIGDVTHVWDRIPGKILPYGDPSYLSVGQITRKIGFSFSHWLSNKRARKNPLRQH